MSFLTPLYILGALTIAAPIVFHLIRRTTKGETPFGSLMFLAPSPPRLTRRSRLENWPLLLLRALALALLAAAFARPFLRESADLNLTGVERSRVVLLVDASASMRRGDVWEKAKAKALDVIASIRPEDQLAVLAFDAEARVMLGFDESATLDPSRRRAVAASLVKGLTPGWRGTHLGQALIDAVGALENIGDEARGSASDARKVVLVSDLQQGSRLDVLGDFEWPPDVELDVKSVADDGSNAGLELLAPADATTAAASDGKAGAEADSDAYRVRVSNDARSRSESFTLRWEGDAKAAPIPVYVPPGESRVVRVPKPRGGPLGRSLRLEGDTRDFDDALYIATAPEEAALVLFVGNDAPDDPNGLLYYLSRVFDASPRRVVKVEPRPPSAPLALDVERPPALVVLAGETSPSNASALAAHVREGGTVLAVASPGKATTLATIAGVPAFDVEDAPAGGDVMLGEIAFDHPLFAPFAGPQFNDFTRIRYRKYRKLPADALGEVRAAARFETGDPAVIEKRAGKGRLVVMTSGWAPADGSLARSSKFVPLMAALLEGPNAASEVSEPLLVGDALKAPEGAAAVRKPDGTTTRLADGALDFRETDEPGIYTIETKEGPRAIAVNLDPAESKTAPLDVAALEQFGCRLTRPVRDVEAEHASIRQMRNAELEGRQKLWRPVILAAIAVLTVETWLAGRLGRSRPAQEGAPAS